VRPQLIELERLADPQSAVRCGKVVDQQELAWVEPDELLGRLGVEPAPCKMLALLIDGVNSIPRALMRATCCATSATFPPALAAYNAGPGAGARLRLPAGDPRDRRLRA
jgi:hypothetical protein